LSTREGVGAKAGLDDLVLAHVVDGQFILLLDVDQKFAQLRIVEGCGGFADQGGGGLLSLLFARLVCAELLFGPFFLPIGIDRFD
jgi:hypothetical protein